MKKCPSVVKMAAVAIAATGVYFGVASAQSTSNTTNATIGATVTAPLSYQWYSNTPATTNTPAHGASQEAGLTYGVNEVLKMYKGGIGKDVIVNFVENTALPYHLTADNIIYLQGLGLPQEITKAMIQRDGQLQQQQQMANLQFYQQQQMQQSLPPAVQPVPSQSPSPDVATPSTPPPTVIETDPGSYYDYGYPYYGWPYYGPVVVGGWGWGWGHGFRGGFHGGGFGHGGGGFGHGGGHR